MQGGLEPRPGSCYSDRGTRVAHMGTRGYGIFSWFGYRPALERRVRAIKAAGYQATALWLGRHEPLVHEGKADTIPSVIRDGGLFFEYVHAPYGNVNKLWSADPSERAVIRGDYASAIRFCARHRVPTVVMHVVKGINPPAYASGGRDTFADLVKLAEDLGVRIAVENTRHEAYVERILESLDSPSLGFCYDSSHDFLHGEEAGAVLARWGKRLLVTHLSDNDGLADRHWLPGLGTGRWEAVARSFPPSYGGYLTLEVLPKREQFGDPERFLRDGVARLDWIASLVRDASSQA